MRHLVLVVAGLTTGCLKPVSEDAGCEAHLESEFSPPFSATSQALAERRDGVLYLPASAHSAPAGFAVMSPEGPCASAFSGSWLHTQRAVFERWFASNENGAHLVVYPHPFDSVATGASCRSDGGFEPAALVTSLGFPNAQRRAAVRGVDDGGLEVCRPTWDDAGRPRALERVSSAGVVLDTFASSADRCLDLLGDRAVQANADGGAGAVINFATGLHELALPASSNCTLISEGAVCGGARLTRSTTAGTETLADGGTWEVLRALSGRLYVVRDAQTAPSFFILDGTRLLPLEGRPSPPAFVGDWDDTHSFIGTIRLPGASIAPTDSGVLVVLDVACLPH